MKLSQAFYLNDNVTEVAKHLLGKVLCVNINGSILSGKIVETEAYSYKEKACHAYNARYTKRTEVLFMEGGTAYVYLCYGIHKLFNVVTNVEGVAEAVLIRALEPVDNVKMMQENRKMIKNTALTSGPGKLSQAMGINLDHNRQSLTKSNVWIEDRRLDVGQVEKTPRIGVAYAMEDALLPWRFIEKDNPFVSKGNNTYHL